MKGPVGMPHPAGAPHAPTAERDRSALPEQDCASPGWRSAGACDASAPSNPKSPWRFARPDRRWARPPATAPVRSPAPARSPLAAALPRTAPRPAAVPAMPVRLPRASCPAVSSASRKLASRISSGMATFSAAVKSGSKMMPLPDETDLAIPIIPQAASSETIPVLSPRSILYRSLACPARPADAAKYFSRARTARRSQSFRLRATDRSTPSRTRDGSVARCRKLCADRGLRAAARRSRRRAAVFAGRRSRSRPA